MIIGGCPYCDASQMNPYAGPGKMEKIECDACHKFYWLRHSNIDPQAFTAEDFAERFELNESTKTLVDKDERKRQEMREANPALAALIDAKVEEIAKQAADDYIHGLLYGFPGEAAPDDYSGGGLAQFLKND